MGLEALSLSVSAFLDLPAASCPLSRWRGRRAPRGGQTLSLQALELHLCSFWDRTVLLSCIDSATAYRVSSVPGVVWCSARTKMTSWGHARLQAGPCQCAPSHRPFLVLFLNLILTSEFKGWSLFILQPLQVLI